MSENEAPKGKGGLNAPVTAKSGCLTALLFIGLAVLVAKVMPDKKEEIAAPAVAKSTPTPAPTPKADIETLPVISVAKLYQSHSVNSLAAEKMTKNKEMVVVGKVGDTGKDVLGESYVILTDGRGHETQMMFERADEDALLHIAKGQVAAVRGIVGGKGFVGSIVCRKCSLVKVE